MILMKKRFFEPGENITTGDVVCMVMNTAQRMRIISTLSDDDYLALSSLIGDVYDEAKNQLLKRYIAHVKEQTGYFELPGGTPCDKCGLNREDYKVLCKLADELEEGK